MTQRRTAFTLLELLTVIAIIGLLVAILIPSLSAARRSAKANVCLAHVKGIGNGFSVYLNENNDQFPPFRLYKTAPSNEEYYVNEVGRRAPRWQWFLETELGPVIDPVPFARDIGSYGYYGDYTLGGAIGGLGTKMSHEVFTCPSIMDEEYQNDIRNGAYGYNYQYLGNTRRDVISSRWDNFSVGLHKIRKTGSTVVMADSRGAGRKHGRHSFTLDPPRLATERNATRFGPNQDTYEAPGLAAAIPEDTDDTDTGANAGLGDVQPGAPFEVYAYSPVEDRHNGRGNVLFVDTHAEAMSLKELGYELADGNAATGIPFGTPLPILLSEDEGSVYRATNKLWNGEGVDRIAQEHRAE